MAPLEPGSIVGNYEVEEEIGRGGMGVVYRARDLRLGRRVALKVLSADIAGDVHFRERFLRESQTAASIDHPNVLPIYEPGEIDGELFLVMRYVEGGEDLGKVLDRDRPLAPERALSLVSQVADALDVVHRAGLVHRDVKPSNVLISTSGAREHAYLTDFGVTKLATGPTLTESGALLGTVAYCAPEAIRGEALDGRTDVYSLGCVLFECLTGEVPFARDSQVASIYAHLEEEPPSLRERRPELPLALEDVVARALAKKPEERFASAGELAGAASAALGRKASSGPPSAAAVPAPGQHRRPAREGAWAGRGRVLAIGGGLVAAAAVSVALIASSRGGDKPETTAGARPSATSTTSPTSENYTPAPVASGTTRVGSDLGWPPGDTGHCGDAPGRTCTYLQLTLGMNDQSVPRDGVITAWSVRGGKGELTLKVIAGQEGRRRVVASSATVQARGSPGVQTFRVRIPVRAGQRVAVELGRTGFVPIRYLDEKTTGEQFEPPLGEAPSEPLPKAAVARGYEISYNATIEPDRDRDGLGDKTQDRDPGTRG